MSDRVDIEVVRAACRTLLDVLDNPNWNCDDPEAECYAEHAALWAEHRDTAIVALHAALAESGNTDRCPTCGSDKRAVRKLPEHGPMTPYRPYGRRVRKFCTDPWHRATDTEGEK